MRNRLMFIGAGRGACLILMWGLLQAVSAAEDKPQELKMQNPLVVTSFTVLKDMAQIVSAGTPVKVVSLVGPYGDPHVYEPRVSDMRLLQAADLILINGLMFEPLIAVLIGSSGWKSKTQEVTQGLQVRHVQQGKTLIADPHCWHNVANGLHYLKVIRNVLCSKFPEYKTVFKKNAQSYKKKLESLHVYLLNRLAAIPANQRCAIVEHQAFGYMEAAYGVNFISPLGISTAAAEPSAKVLKNLIVQAKNLGARVIFFETLIPSPLLNHIHRETGLPLKGRLYSDALSDPKDGASTYIKFMESNGELLYRTLGAPLGLAKDDAFPRSKLNFKRTSSEKNS